MIVQVLNSRRTNLCCSHEQFSYMMLPWLRRMEFSENLNASALCGDHSLAWRWPLQLGCGDLDTWRPLRPLLAYAEILTCFMALFSSEQVNNRAKSLSISQVIKAKSYNSCLIFIYKNVFIIIWHHVLLSLSYFSHTTHAYASVPSLMLE
jgi:hypothetical protein